MFTHKSEMHVACNFNRLIKTKDFRKSGNISETVQDRDVLTANH